MYQRGKLLILLALLVGASSAWSWGPHTHITAAALVVLPERQRLEKYLGPEFQRLAKDYVWMADWKEAVRPDHYADDYLLFPGMTTHLSHMLPQVRQTYEPYFRRALQAIRTESPHNAARWVGSLLHFVQDSGSPPHTTGIGGLLHAKMEQWVDETQIAISGYQPRLLGKNEAEALRGFVNRMEKLVAFAKVRALKLKPLVENLTERVNQPLELECALETARVTTDVVHTLFTLGLAEPIEPGCILAGKIQAPPPAGYARVPARILLANTTFATTADADGSFRFRHLPAGNYKVWIQATGYDVKEISSVALRSEKPTHLKVELQPDAVPGNLVRNPRFQLCWLKPGQPNGWTRDPLKAGRWASALIRVPVDQKCRLQVTFQPGKEAPVAVRWRANPSLPADGRETGLNLKKLDAKGRRIADLEPDPRLKPFEKGFLFLEVLFAVDSLAPVLQHVAVGFLPKHNP